MAIDEAALQALIDRQQIAEALGRYARGMDRHDTALIESAYHPDALDTRGGVTCGPAEVARRAIEAHERHFGPHQHYVTNLTVELDGDQAHAESYWMACFARTDGLGVDVGGGRYVDRLERREGRWAIARRVVVAEWSAAWSGRELTPMLAEALGRFERGRCDREDLSYRRPLT